MNSQSRPIMNAERRRSPGAAENNASNSRQEAQESQSRYRNETVLASLAPLRGNSVGPASSDQGYQSKPACLPKSLPPDTQRLRWTSRRRWGKPFRATLAQAGTSTPNFRSRAMTKGLIRPQKIKVNQGKSNQIKVNQGILKHFFCGERDRPGRCAGRLAPHFPGQDVLGGTPNTARGTHALPIPSHCFCRTKPNCRGGRADWSVAAEAGQWHGKQRLSWSDSPDNHSSDTFFCAIHLSAIRSRLIPTVSLGIDAKGRVFGLEMISACSLQDGWPGQAQSKWVKVGQTNLWKG